MTCRKAKRLISRKNRHQYIVSVMSVVLFLVSSAVFAQQVHHYNAVPVNSNSQLRWGNPDINAQQRALPSSQRTSQSAQPAGNSQITLVQHTQAVQAPMLLPVEGTEASDTPMLLAQIPGSRSGTSVYLDTINREGPTRNTPNVAAPIPQPMSSTTTFVDSGSSSTPLATNSNAAYDFQSEKDRYRCLDPRTFAKPLHELSIQMDPMDLSDLNNCTINVGEYQQRNWQRTCFTFVPSALCVSSAYFDDPAVERYGHSWGPFLQPVMSAGHFYGSVLFLPYQMGLTPPCECEYDLGYYRPGSCAPYMVDPLPISIRAGLMQAGAVVGLSYALP